jgi:hypothetical protein
MKMCTVIVLKITISYDDKGIVTATRKCMIQTKLHAGNQWIFLCLIQRHEGDRREYEGKTSLSTEACGSLNLPQLREMVEGICQAELPIGAAGTARTAMSGCREGH